MSEDAILNEIKHMRANVTRMDKRMEGMETAINLVAVQTQQINTLDRDVTKLWDVKDECSKDIVELKRFQASCPRGSIEKDIQTIRDNTRESLRNQWVAIGILATAFIATGVWKVI